MAENLNLELDFVPQRKGGAAGSRPTSARVYLGLACGYLKSGGQPTLTTDCRSFEEFEREVERLKNECDALLGEAAERFGTGGRTAPDEQPAPKAATAAARPSGKTALRLEQDLRVADRMTREVKTLHPNDMLSVADELMRTGHFRHVVVLDDDGDDVIGVLSQRDIFYGALAWSLGQGSAAHQKTLDAVPVKQVMRSDVRTIAPDTPLTEAAHILLTEQIGCLPVLEDRKLVGILTEADFLAMLTEAEHQP